MEAQKPVDERVNSSTMARAVDDRRLKNRQPGRWKFVDVSRQWHWWTRIPNIIFEELTDAYEFRLYFHYKRVCGDHGVCWQTNENIAKMTGMSAGMVTKARRALEEKGLIRCEMRKPLGSRGRPCWHVTILDIWEKNEQVYQARYGKQISSRDEQSQGICSPDEGNASPHEGYRSPHEGYPSPREAKKNPIKNIHPKNIHQQQPLDDANQSYTLLKKFGLKGRLLSEIARYRDPLWCRWAIERSRRPGGVVELYRNGSRPEDDKEWRRRHTRDRSAYAPPAIGRRMGEVPTGTTT